jgi:hypothetical protein
VVGVGADAGTGGAGGAAIPITAAGGAAIPITAADGAAIPTIAADGTDRVSAFGSDISGVTAGPRKEVK